MKKIAFLLATVILIAGAGGTYGYFFIFNKDNEIDSTIALNLSNNPIPIWYLYGEEALLQRISLLKNRSDDSPFVQEINELDIEKLRLESFNLENETLNAIEITKLAEANTIAYKPSKRLLVTLAFLAGLILSFIIVIFNYKINFDNELTDSTT